VDTPYSLEPSFMPHRYFGAVALALGLPLFAPTLLSAQSADSVPAPHLMTAVVVNGSHRPSARENARLKRELARYDARIAALELHLDSLKTYADSLDRDRVYFEAAAAHARARRMAMEQRLRDLEARTARSSDAPISTP
jgi:septal ring factor EnvC (AmiA/AmiB activator)